MRKPQTSMPAPTLTPVIATLLVANIAMFLAQEFNSAAMIRTFALWPLNWGKLGNARFELWQLVSYGFLHNSLSHMIFNLLALWMFGNVLERLWGARRFLVYYLACVIGAGLMQLAFGELGFGSSVVVGASGGVFGLLLAFAMAYPREIILPLVPPIPMRAMNLAILYGIAALLFGLTGSVRMVAHFAHLGGMVAGLILMLALPQVFIRPSLG